MFLQTIGNHDMTRHATLAISDENFTLPVTKFKITTPKISGFTDPESRAAQQIDDHPFPDARDFPFLCIEFGLVSHGSSKEFDLFVIEVLDPINVFDPGFRFGFGSTIFLDW